MSYSSPATDDRKRSARRIVQARLVDRAGGLRLYGRPKQIGGQFLPSIARWTRN
jgi:hypothetical protein